MTSSLPSFPPVVEVRFSKPLPLLAILTPHSQHTHRTAESAQADEPAQMQTPTPLDRIARGQLVPSPAQRNPMASTSTPAYRPFASGAVASVPFRQTMAASALFRSRPSTSAQTPDRPREEGEQQVTRPESPYKVLSGSPSGGQINYSRPSATPNSTPQKSASADVTRLSPASATAVGRARAAASLRRGLVIAFFWILLATARPYRCACLPS